MKNPYDVLKKSISLLFAVNPKDLEGESVILEKRIVSEKRFSLEQKKSLLVLLRKQRDQIHAEKSLGYVVHGRKQTSAQALKRIKNGLK